MHETGIVQALIEQVEKHARERHADAVASVTVRIGELSGVEAVALQRAFETFRERTLAAGAELVIVPVEAQWRCRHCDRELARGERLQCPVCGAPARLAAGEEIVLDRIEMEVP